VPLAALLRGIDMACAAGAVLAALAAVALATILVTEVVLSSFFSTGQPYAIEYSIYLQAVVMFGGAGWALRNGGHVRVAMLTATLPAGARRAVEAAVSALGLGIIGFAAFALVNQAWRSFDFGSVSYYPMQTPVWIPQAALALCFVLFAAALAARLIRALAGEPEEIANTVGGTIE
jgi:TRAP-type C4-dicarboxylate transport system permease small subunit